MIELDAMNIFAGRPRMLTRDLFVVASLLVRFRIRPSETRSVCDCVTIAGRSVRPEQVAVV